MINHEMNFPEDEGMEEMSMKVSPEDFFKLMREIPEVTSKTYFSIYLAGPVEKDLNESEPKSLIWRKKITELFDADSLTWDLRDPTRGKVKELEDGSRVYDKNLENSFLYNPRHIFARDISDLYDSDIYLADLSDMDSVAVGTNFEMGYAYAQRKPIVLIIPAQSTLRHHPFISSCSNFIVESVEEAFAACSFLRKTLTNETKN